jgi:type IX secretion system PorP/SprF family membrane protein
MKHKIIISIAIIALGAKGFSQQGTPLSQFSSNQIVYNPGYAGLAEVLSLNLAIHQSWIKIPGAPRVVNLNGHAPFGFDEKQAWGWVFQNEAMGPLQENSVYANYAYKVYLGKGALNFGLQAGILLQTVNWDEVREHVGSDNDPTLGTGRQHTAKFDANVGIYYRAPSWFFGISTKHLTNPKYDKIEIGQGDNKKEWYSQMGQQFFAMTGFNIRMGNDWALRPEALLRYAIDVPTSFNVGMHFNYMGLYGFGINYLSGQNGISFSARASITPELKIGYSYDVFFGLIKPHQRGSHEISLSYSVRREDDPYRQLRQQMNQ